MSATDMEDKPHHPGHMAGLGHGPYRQRQNGISSLRAAPALGHHQHTDAWFLGHRIRLALQACTMEKLSGEVEQTRRTTGGSSKTCTSNETRNGGAWHWRVWQSYRHGLLERRPSKAQSSKVRSSIYPTRGAQRFKAKFANMVAARSRSLRISCQSYNGLNANYVPQAVDHSVEYVRGTSIRMDWKFLVPAQAPPCFGGWWGGSQRHLVSVRTASICFATMETIKHSGTQQQPVRR